MGSVYKVSPAGVESLLYSFPSTIGPESMNPSGGLLQASDGNFYGVTRFGGAAGRGTVYRITPDGTFTQIYAFQADPDGRAPTGSLIQATDGNLYGTTTDGGSASAGTVFRLTLTGTETVLYSFTGRSDGMYPQTGVIQARDGQLYGTTPFGDLINQIGGGTVFRLGLSGEYKLMHSFSSSGEGGALPVGD